MQRGARPKIRGLRLRLAAGDIKYEPPRAEIGYKYLSQDFLINRTGIIQLHLHSPFFSARVKRAAPRNGA